MNEHLMNPEKSHTTNFAGDSIPTDAAMQRCIQCGMCLPHCPTYVDLGVERASPRGRAALIKMAAEGKIEIDQSFSDQMYLCLDCRACETACPAGVQIGYLVESARAQVEQNKPMNPFLSLFRQFVFGWLFMRHWRLELVALPLRIYQQTGLQEFVHESGILKFMPKILRFMEELPPRNLKQPFRKTIPDIIPAKGEEHARVGYFLGCMMSILFNKTTNATVNVLQNSGCTIITPKEIRCCGAPLMSDGFKPKAKELMKFNIDLFEKLDVDYIITDCAACGAALKEYEEVFEDDPEYHEKAKRFSAKAREITEFLGEWEHFKGGEMPKPECRCGGEDECGSKAKTVTYDAPCHLCHAQQVWDQPVKLIKQIPDVEYKPLKEADWCCGSAGIYNITNHDMSMKILDKKMKRIEENGADIVLTANPGCMLQLDYGIRKRGLKMEVKHVVEMLDQSKTNQKS
jgi:glycolate oxidase iron-sulfur subunit